jgi:uncharacterized membrane protein
MQREIKTLIVCTLLILALDACWISFNLRAYQNQVIKVQRVVMQVKPVGAIISYCAIIFALYYFILLKKRPVLEAFLLGLAVYAVYDFTNYAMLKKWDPMLACADTLWGGVLYATTAFITYSVMYPTGNFEIV